MTVSENVSGQKTNNQSMTSVNIEEHDESWALKLMREYDVDEDHILLNEESTSKRDFASNRPKHATSDHSAYFSSDRLDQAPSEEIGADMLSLSAIEIQRLNQAKKIAAQAELADSETLKSRFSLAKFKRLLSV